MVRDGLTSLRNEATWSADIREVQQLVSDLSHFSERADVNIEMFRSGKSWLT